MSALTTEPQLTLDPKLAAVCKHCGYKVFEHDEVALRCPTCDEDAAWYAQGWN